ncbi:MAG: response regulator transcription factor [Chloroflexi bacterium]|nr:response regulator transcription factor [Chloroflexota bacterium]
MAQRILVVDDDKGIVRLMRAYLEQAGFQVLVAYDGKSAMRCLRQDQPDLVVLDLMLPDLDGWEITRIMRSDETLAKIPILMLTARIEDSDRILGLELGADDYLPKPFNPQVVCAHVRAVLRRTLAEPVIPKQVCIGELCLDLDRHEVSVACKPVELTPTEFEFLRALMEHPDHAFTRTELIEAALGYTYEGLERTVDSHIKNLRAKVEPNPRSPTYIQTVYGVGYRLQGAP